MNVALIPIKRLSVGKSRLLPELPRAALEALTLAMLEDITDALSATSAVNRVAVVTPDADVASRAEHAGAIALLRADPGLNESIDAAAAELSLRDSDALLVVLGDVAAARSEDFEQIFEVAEHSDGPCAVLAPSRDGGSSALLRRPWDAIPSSFGADSAKKHREAAQLHGVVWHELPLASLSLDLDSREDLEAFVREQRGGSRTRALLAELGWGKDS